jgi:NAD-dependent deacetylase
MNRLVHWLKQAGNAVVFTGAGMSTESGLPDFRSSLQGIWRGKDPVQFASTHALHHNRTAFVDFYRMRVEGLRKCKPHRGHDILAQWEQQGIVSGIITQNVDGFHQRAGSRRVAELHGSLRTLFCMDCGDSYPSERYLEPDGTVCACGGFLRPSVVLFGETLPETALSEAEALTEGTDLFIVLGSSLQVSPANWFPQQAKSRGAKLVIVNMEPTELDSIADLVVHGEKIGDVLAQIDKEIANI